MENPTTTLLASLENIETHELSLMKDSLTNFFKDWVDACHDAGHLPRDVHEQHTWHFTAMRDLLNNVLDYKLKMNLNENINKGLSSFQ